MNSLKKLPKFIHQCMTIGEIPTSYKVSLTYEEQLMWFCRFLEEQVIPVVNNNSEVVQELKTFIENYFDNLDVQEEINNKLDEMAEDGTLEEIITEYINLKSILSYNNVAEMKQATNLINGSFAKTYGYYSANDKGGAFYKIRNITNQDVVNDTTIISLSDENLIAELIIDGNAINVRQFGIKGNGTDDDSTLFQNMIDYFENERTTILLNNGDNYLINTGLIIPFYINFACNGNAIFTYKGNDYAFTITRGIREYHDTIIGQGNDINKLMEYGNIVITSDNQSAIISTTFVAGGIKVLSSDNSGNVILHDYDINNCAFMFLTVGVYLKAIHLFAVGINNCKFNYCHVCTLYGVESGETSIDAGERMYMNNNFMYNSGIGLVFKNTTPSDYAITNCSFDNIGCVLYHNNTLENVVFDKCHIENIGNVSNIAMKDYIDINYPNAFYHIVYNAYNSIYQAGIITIMNSLLHLTSMTIDKFAFDGIYNTYSAVNINFRRKLTNLNLQNNFYDLPTTSGLSYVLANMCIYYVFPFHESSYVPYYAYAINYDDVFHFSETSISSTDDYFVKRGITFSYNATYDLTEVSDAPFGITKKINIYSGGNLRTFHKVGKIASKGVNAYVIIQVSDPSIIGTNSFNVTFTDENGLSQTKYMDVSKKINLGNGYYMYCASVDAPSNALHEVDILFNIYSSSSQVYLCGLGFLPYN